MKEKLTNQERLAKIPNSEKAKMMFLIKKKQEMEMEKNMKAVPNLKWWENEQEAKKSIEQQKPVTPEEAQAQFSRLRNEDSQKPMSLVERLKAIIFKNILERNKAQEEKESMGKK